MKKEREESMLGKGEDRKLGKGRGEGKRGGRKQRERAEGGRVKVRSEL